MTTSPGAQVQHGLVLHQILYALRGLAHGKHEAHAVCALEDNRRLAQRIFRREFRVRISGDVSAGWSEDVVIFGQQLVVQIQICTVSEEKNYTKNTMGKVSFRS